MSAVFIDADSTMVTDQIINWPRSVDLDATMCQVAGGMGIVSAIIDLIENHLCITPSLLFGGPLCFFGSEIYLAIRGSVRLCGIISSISKPSSIEMYSNIMLITRKIGPGKFKAAEALESVLMSWPSLVENICYDHPDFVDVLWNVVKQGDLRSAAVQSHSMVNYLVLRSCRDLRIALDSDASTQPHTSTRQVTNLSPGCRSQELTSTKQMVITVICSRQSAASVAYRSPTIRVYYVKRCRATA
eukprot:SAG11_NODE_3778_length_2233_cov_1.310216_3_plen_244_part_00